MSDELQQVKQFIDKTMKANGFVKIIEGIPMYCEQEEKDPYLKCLTKAKQKE